uniref:HRDC domain-containing protein n=1 Tax=Kalanchoe fedtschenkoi TaxID=63787 RepID=A0A7N0RIB4_KALFE
MDVDSCRPDDQPPTKCIKVEALQALTSGPLRSSLSKLSASSRAIPSDKDFHFYYNFNEFKLPVKDIVSLSESVLERIGLAGDLLGKLMSFPGGDMDESHDWVVGVDDEILERFDSSVDEFERVRKREEDGVGRGRGVGMEKDGFQLVCGKKSKKVNLGEEAAATMSSGDDLSHSGVKMAFKDKKTLGTKPRVPFHIPAIRRPQDEYKILVNNANQPFEHVWLERSEDGSRFVHPLERLSVLDFVDKNVGALKPIEPPSFESTPFKLIQEVKDLKEMSAKLRGVDEFAVDLEHNQYRSFQGLTCLMQISTRTEDYIVDTLKLRVHVGPYLREVFKDPTKKKVMQGADRDIVWLQRDFGIYICNLFDSGQASRVLKLERNSLEYLLHHFCRVSANKEYQNADWRLRPLPEQMIRYARDDTHYLLYIYDLLKIELTKMPKDPEKADDPLLEVYKRSWDVCMQFYEKELLTENSYLYIYGLLDSNFNAQQLAIVSGLCVWRDIVARAEDESTGYILPNKTLLEIAKQMPVTVGKLRRLVKSKYPYVERNIGAVLSSIFHAIQNASAFEAVAEQLKQGALNVVQEETIPVEKVEDTSVSARMEVKDTSASSIRIDITMNGDVMPTCEDKSGDFVKTQYDIYGKGSLHGNFGNRSNLTGRSYDYAPAYPNVNAAITVSARTEIVETASGESGKVSAFKCRRNQVVHLVLCLEHVL